MDEAGEELEDKECAGKDKTTTRPCMMKECAEWTVGHWLGVRLLDLNHFDKIVLFP